jgi:hypothetical protein
MKKLRRSGNEKSKEKQPSLSLLGIWVGRVRSSNGERASLLSLSSSSSSSTRRPCLSNLEAQITSDLRGVLLDGSRRDGRGRRIGHLLVCGSTGKVVEAEGGEHLEMRRGRRRRRRRRGALGRGSRFGWGFGRGWFLGVCGGLGRERREGDDTLGRGR